MEFSFKMRSPHVDSHHRWASVWQLLKLYQCEILHLSPQIFPAEAFACLPTEACTMALLLVGFYKLVLAACGRRLNLNGFVCYKRRKEAASSI